MTTRRISQREARRLRKRVEELERRNREQVSAWSSGYPGGHHIATIDLADWLKGRAWMAQQLGCAIVGKYDGESLRVYVVPKAQP